MQHAFLDKYSDLNSPVHRVDARVKIVGFLAIIVICISTPASSFKVFLAYFALLLCLLLLSRIPPMHVIKRMAVVLPFILMVAIFIPFFKKGGGSYNLGPLVVSTGGLLVLWNVTVKSLISILAVILLSSTTPFPQLLKGMERLRVPKLLIALLSFTYRYIFILVDEVQRMRRARDSRGWRGRWLWEGKVIGHMISTLFIRSYERGERVYAAMLARGYDGLVRTFQLGVLKLEDWGFVFLLVALPLTVRIFTV